MAVLVAGRLDLCLTPVIFALIAALMLIERDISAPSWIIDRIEARAGTLLAGGELQFGDVSLRIAKDLHPTVRLSDIQLRDADQALIAQIPAIEGLMSPRGLILQQDVLLQDVQLTGAHINLRRAQNGAVAVAFDAGGRTVQQARSLPELLERIDRFLQQPAFEALETVRAEGVIINFDDARAGRSWIVDGGAIALDLRGNTTVLRGEFAVLSGRADVTTANLSYASPKGRPEAQIALSIRDAVASDIAAQSPGLQWLANVEAPVSAALRTTLDESGALGPLNATLEIGAGTLQPNPATRPVSFRSAKTYLTYNPRRNHIVFDQISAQTEWGQFAGRGDAYLREFQNGLPQAFLGQFALSDILINPADLYDQPLALDNAIVDLRVRVAPFSVELGQLIISDGPSRLLAKGDISAEQDGWRVAIDAQLDQSTPERVKRYWPTSFRPGTRTWIENNLSEGRLFDGVAGFRLIPGSAPQFAGQFAFADTQIQFMRSMPPIRDSHGMLTFQDRSMVIALDRGRVFAPEGGTMQLAGSNMEISELGVKNPPASLNLRINSSATAVLSILNQPPFGFLDKVNLPVTLIDGRAALAGNITFPIRKRIPTPDVVFDVDVDLGAARSRALLPGRNLATSGMQVQADNAGLLVTGPARVGDVPVNIRYSRGFGPDANGRSRVSGDIEISPKFLDEFGIALPPGMITGRGRGDMVIELPPNAPPRLSLRSNLRGVGVALPAVGWSKPPGQAGDLVVEGTLGAIPEISKLQVSGGGLSAAGRIALNADRQLEVAEFSTLRVGDWLNAPVTLRGRGPGNAPAVAINGGVVDLRRARFGAGNNDSGGPVALRLDRLQVSEGIALTGFAGDFDSRGGFSGEFTARVNGAATVRGAVAPRDGRSAVRIQSNDAGGVARAAGFLQGGVGGSLDLTLLPARSAGVFDGFLAVRGLRVRDAPTIAALLDAISVIGLLRQLDGQGLAFDEVDAQFRLGPQQVTIAQASAVGPGLGISVDGIYTLANKQLDLQGVVSPFYLVNSIGSILTRRGEGLIGFNFNITGSANAPRVSVNPLSALTPGMFREIFRRPPPVLSQ